ncbi:MAG: radical SAM protein [bacterium]|nr:radical SAM protein [bacterium]
MKPKPGLPDAVTPLTVKYQRKSDGDYRVALVSLFHYENMGLRFVYTFLKECGYDVDLVLFKELGLNYFKPPTRKELDLLIDLLRRRGVKAVGLSARSPYHDQAAEMTELIRKQLGVPVFWGGTMATVTPEMCIDRGADYAVCGEGEEACAELMEALSTGADPTGIKNLWYRGPNGPVGNPLRPLVEDLDSLPFVDLENEGKFSIEYGKLSEGEPMQDWVRYEMSASRGCPYRCSYCSNSLFHEMYEGLGQYVRLRSVDHVMRELEYAQSRMPNMKNIFFRDEVFGLTRKWLEEFADQFPKRIGVQFECATDVRSLTEEKIVLLKELGLAEVNIGLQAGSDRIRHDVFHRYITNEEYLETAHLVRKYGLFARYDIITDNPFETNEDKRASLDLLLALPRPFVLNLFSLCHFPRTKLTEFAIEQGVITREDVVKDMDKVLNQLTVTFDHPRSKEDSFWCALYMLTSKEFIPKRLIRRLAESRWLRHHPAPIKLLSKVSNLLRVAYAGTRLLIAGRIDMNVTRRFLRSIGRINR